MRRRITQPLYNEATVPLRRELLCQPVLPGMIWGKQSYPLPKLTEGQQFRVYDADNWQQDNGQEELYYSREIMKVR